MHRFFIPLEAFTGDAVDITGGAAWQISRVLRLKPGDHIIVLDNTGWEYEAVIESTGRDEVKGKIAKKVLGVAEPGVSVTLCQALIKADKFEFVLQKGTEIGVSTFLPFASERCVAAKPSEEKIARWHAVVREAAEQCGRAVLPVLLPPVGFRELCQPSATPSLILWEGERTHGLSKTLKAGPFLGARALRVFVGPEGGFTRQEVTQALGAHILPAGLGKRILRAETAGLAAVSAIMYEMGELG